MSPLLDKQRRGQIIGRIRTGYRNASGNPVKSKTLIFTTGNRRAAAAIAELHGGEVRPWDVRPGEFIVRTTVAEIDVTIPPRDQVITQWYEMWTAAGCARRCDSVTEQIKNIPCPCPSDPDERARLAKQKTPAACKPRTRINVMIPDLPGMGVWTLATGSDQAACEVEDAGDLMTMAREQGIFLPATLRLEQRETRTVGEPTKQYGVPVLEPINTFREIATGALAAAGIAGQLPPAPGQQRRALTAGPVTAPPAPAAVAPDAQTLADRAWAARTQNDIRALISLAKEHLLADELVLTDAENDVYEELKGFLTERYNRMPAEQVPA